MIVLRWDYLPFVDDKKRKKYLDIVRKDIITDLIS